jgi:hypothetical protein
VKKNIKSTLIVLAILFSMVIMSACTNTNNTLKPRNNNSNVMKDTGKVEVLIGDEISIKLDLEDWNYALKKEDMPSSIRNFAKDLESQGASMSLFGLSKDGNEGIRIISEPTGMENDEYLEVIQFVNKDDLTQYTDWEDANFGNTNGILWSYDLVAENSVSFTYYEYIIKEGKYNIRITMWTTIDSFNEKKSNFERMINSIEL